MFRFNRKGSKRPRPHKQSAKRWLSLERLEEREVLSAFSVVNLNDHGAGSLRQALLDANRAPGADVINFSVAGTIRLTTGPLPNLTDRVDINGTTAPGFAGTPVVEVDFNLTGGLWFDSRSAGSALRSLSLVNAGGNGVTLNSGGSNLIVGNYIGINPDGTTANGNRGDGLQLIVSYGNMIGGATPLARNVISANYNNGIELIVSSSNQIAGNDVGTDATGTLDRGNRNNGIFVNCGSGNLVGGTQGNLVSGNDGNGIYLVGNASHDTLSGNIVGLAAGGVVPLGNRFDGVKLDGGTSNNLIGHSDPVTGVDYFNADNVPTQPVSGWQGIRGGDIAGEVLIAGTSDSDGLLFRGTIAGVGTSDAFDFPGAFTTSAYGPDNLGLGNVRIVGVYKYSDYATAPVFSHGFLYEGTTAGFGDPANYRTIDFPGAKFNYVHSTMGGLVVGNYDSPVDHGKFNLPFGPGHAYIYDIAQDQFLTDVVFPGSKTNSAYGLWYNGGTSYTICGGYGLDAVSNFDDQTKPLGHGFLVDYDSATGQFSHWASFDYPKGTNIITHFEGISSVEKGVYTLSADSVQRGTGNPVQGSWVTVRRNTDGSFGPATWVDLNYTGVDPTTHVTSSNSVYGNQVVGIVIGASSFSFQATVNIGFQLSNVISGNGQNGISLYASNGNQIAMNNIGTDITGTLDRGNGQNGILVTAGSSRNLIGGEATGGNDPTADVFVRPPQGNLISGNNADGVLITGGASQNQLSGNFVGTAASGNSALGNSLDGVGIVGGFNNSLIGCTFQESPFVFYNVISGNGGNGLRVTNSNDTTIQANVFGIGADNLTALGNAANGVLVEGGSTRTVMGGPIPLGNVDSANGQNGIYVRDAASYFTSYNTFCGLAAFRDDPTLGNGNDGMLITSVGGNILIRTCVITENHHDGIEIGGAARDVRVAGNIIGLNTEGLLPMGNLGNGVEIDGNAHDNLIGGPQPTFNVIPRNIISANGADGVAIDGNAFHNTVSFGYIGLDINGQLARGNIQDGVLVGPNTFSNTIGSTDPTLPTVISTNSSNGVELRNTRNNTVNGCFIGTAPDGTTPMGNGGNGVYIAGSFDNLIGTTAAGTNNPGANVIAYNAANGVLVASGSRNNIRQNSIHDHVLLGIALAPGANNNQAAPVLTSLQIVPGGIQVSGTLTSQPYMPYTIEFFANDTNAPAGKVYLGSIRVTANSHGVAAFTFVGPSLPAGTHFVTATATDVTNDTSEFSNAVS